jgi:integrase
VTHVRGLKARIERKQVITDEEFKEMLYKAKQIPETFYRLRTIAVLCILRLTGKRRSEVALLEVSDFKIADSYLHVTFTLSKKRKQTVITKRSTKTIPLSGSSDKADFELSKIFREFVAYSKICSSSNKANVGTRITDKHRTAHFWKTSFQSCK